MLLDTHVLLWVLSDPDRVPFEVRARMDASPVVYASVASLWEIAIKTGTGKLIAPDHLPQRTVEADIAVLDVTATHAWAVRDVAGLVHRDPFDRLLVAQSQVERVPFVTADRAILAADISPAVELVDARR